MEKPCTLLRKIFEDGSADTSKSSAKFELKMFSPSPTTSKVRNLKRGEDKAETARTASESVSLCFYNHSSIIPSCLARKMSTNYPGVKLG